MNQEEFGRILNRRFHNSFFRPTALRATRDHSVHGHQPFRPLPPPTGMPPYHLALGDVLHSAAIDHITAAGKLVFHAVGDTGGVKTPLPQQNVARQMEQDVENAAEADRPAFFYHLGDVVYFFGKATEYFPQFYEPYAHYQAPIFAIPGNHDGDLSRAMEAAAVPSLAAFVDNFCQHIPHHSRDALDETRYTMTQPNVYWTLETPFATVVGLYTNVPEGGRLDNDQITWLQLELEHAPTDRALLVAMHHPIYSVDDHHSGSIYMERILDEAIQVSHRVPDAVLTGHVHNYQRFTRVIGDRQVPFLVAGAGGYHNLHRVARNLAAFGQQPPFVVPDVDNVTFERYCDDRFGYLRLEVTPQALKGDYFAVPGFDDPGSTAATHIDSFTLDLQSHRVTTQSVA
jgi:acid phosphatase type 7